MKNIDLHVGLSIAFAITLTACGGDETSRPRVMSRDDGTIVFEGGDTGRQCNAANRTQACACGAIAGRQTCNASFAWGPCECLDPAANGAAGMGGGSPDLSGSGSDPAANKLAADFEWLRSDPNGVVMDCLPGRYEGTFDGGYQSPAAFNAPIPVAALDVSGMPGLRFDLGSDGNGEFLTISGGMMDGVADGVFPFRAEISDGQLDCATGILRAKLVNGSYDVFFLAFTGHFDGDMVARYDPVMKAFVDGRWAVMEMGATPPPIDVTMPPPVIPLGMPGGAGTWTTSWIR